MNGRSRTLLNVLLSMFFYEPIQLFKYLCHAIAVGLNLRPVEKDMGSTLKGLACEITCPICLNLSCSFQKADFVTAMRHHMTDVQFIVAQLDRGEITLKQAVERLNALAGMKSGNKP